MKFIKADALVLLPISSFVFDGVEQCYTGDREGNIEFKVFN